VPTLKIDGDASGAVAAHAALDSAVGKTKRGYQELGQESDKTGDAQKKAFGSEAVADMATMAAKSFALVEVFKTATAALNEFAETRKRIAAETVSGLAATGQLSAAGGTQADLEMARSLQARGITTGEDQSIRAVTGFVRAGLSQKERAYMIDLAEKQLVDAGSLGQYPQEVRATQRAFADKGSTFIGTEKMLRGGAMDTRFDVGEFGLAATRLAGVAAEAGMSEAQAIAMLATQANKTRNLRTAGGDVEKMIKEGEQFSGKDAIEYAREFKLVQGSQSGAIPTSLVQTDPETAAAYGKRKSDAGYEAMVRSRTSTRENLFSSLVAQRKKSIIENEGEFFGAIDSYFEERMDEKGFAYVIPSVRSIPAAQNAQLQRAVTSERDQYSPDFISNAEKYLETLTKHAEIQTQMMKSDRNQVPPPSGRQE
jgi:hypothetical protein